MSEKVEFTLLCKMQSRWIPHFLAMLKRMEYLGNIGSSRTVSLYADGDGDFQPEFICVSSLLSDIKPKKDERGNHFYDAG